MKPKKRATAPKPVKPIQDRNEDNHLVSKTWKISTTNLFKNIAKNPV